MQDQLHRVISWRVLRKIQPRVYTSLYSGKCLGFLIGSVRGVKPRLQACLYLQGCIYFYLQQKEGKFAYLGFTNETSTGDVDLFDGGSSFQNGLINGLKLYPTQKEIHPLVGAKNALIMKEIIIRKISLYNIINKKNYTYKIIYIYITTIEQANLNWLGLF